MAISGSLNKTPSPVMKSGGLPLPVPLPSFLFLPLKVAWMVLPQDRMAISGSLSGRAILLGG